VEDVMIDKVNLAQKFALITEPWSPKIAGEVNDALVKLVKFQGDFVWHHHEHEDEMFLVVQGRMAIQLRERGSEREVVVGAGEFIIVPRGVEHRPTTAEECWVLLFEPKTTLNTGNVVNERTLEKLGRV
jgi:mannose-6-phosphate isomerase-like protein (cupin superfamily)